MTAAHLLPVPGQTDWLTLVIILGMTVITVVSRSLFFLSSRPLHLPLWFRWACAMRRWQRWPRCWARRFC